jgi:hypothetical protein
MAKENDYFVVEGKLPPTGIETKGYESEGTGVNILTYWVAHNGKIFFDY